MSPIGEAPSMPIASAVVFAPASCSATALNGMNSADDGERTRKTPEAPVTLADQLLKAGEKSA